MLPTVTAAADHAAAQSDRWLFIALLIVFGCFVVYVARYFMGKHDQMQKEYRDERGTLVAKLEANNEKYQANLERVVGQQNATVQSLAVVLDRNTEALKSCTDALRDFRK